MLFACSQPRVHERPFLTESSSHGFDDFYQSHVDNLLTIEPERNIPPPKPISTASFIVDIVHLLIAAPSDSFHFDVECHRFCLAPGLHISGLSPESVLTYSEQFLECGNLYWSLMKFSEPPVLDSFLSAGLIKQVMHFIVHLCDFIMLIQCSQAFQDGLRKYLQYYRACILSLKPDLTLLGLSVQLRGIVDQMRWETFLQVCFGIS